MTKRRKLNAAEYRSTLDAFLPPKAEVIGKMKQRLTPTMADKRTSEFSLPERLPRSLCPPSWSPVWKEPLLRRRWLVVIRVPWLLELLRSEKQIDDEIARTVFERLQLDAEEGCPQSLAALKQLRPAMAEAITKPNEVQQ